MPTLILAVFILSAFGLGWLACALHHSFMAVYRLREADRQHDQWLKDYLKRIQGAA